MDSKVLDIFISWIPMLLLIAVWVYFIRSMQKGGTKWPPYKINEEILEEQRRHHAELEKILTKMEERIAALEARPKS